MAAFALPARRKSDFYHLVRPEQSGSQFEDQPLLAMVGRRGAGKTTPLAEFITHRIENGADPERLLYPPFDADPLYQLQSDEQLRRAVRYYESRIPGRAGGDGPHFVFLDGVHRIEHRNKPAIDGCGRPIADLLDENPDRFVAVTASAAVQIERELDVVAESAAGLSEADYTRLRNDVPSVLYEEVPGFESIETIADNYFPALGAPYLLTAVTEYDNARPRSVQLYLWDTGLLTARADGSLEKALSDFDREADLGRVAGFDHTCGSPTESTPRGRRPAPRQCSSGAAATEIVDYVFEVGDTPVPIDLARPPVGDSLTAVREFLDSHDVPVGFLPTGDTVPTDQPITMRGGRVIQLPYWFYLLLC